MKSCQVKNEQRKELINKLQFFNKFHNTDHVKDLKKIKNYAKKVYSNYVAS